MNFSLTLAYRQMLYDYFDIKPLQYRLGVRLLLTRCYMLVLKMDVCG